jgi:manganese transport protein
MECLLKFANCDSIIHLIAALIVNALLLILGGTLFYHSASLNSLADVFYGLRNPHIIGSLSSPLMSWLFGFALLITGLISSITSTLAGQIVMEGYINICLPLWKRRLLTRFVALIPIVIIGCLIRFNEQEFEQLIIYVQIILSIALPFTLFPLVAITSDRKLMGSHVDQRWQTVIYYLLVILLTALNLMAIF